MKFAGLWLFLACLLTSCAGDQATPFNPAASFPPDSPEARGAAVFMGKGRCAACHSLSPGVVIVGPSLAGVATAAQGREAGLTAAEYLEESILSPDKFKTPGFERLQMDASLAKSLTVDEITDVVAFLLTLK
jgi:nitric oxide reductase subunit C